MFCFFTSGDNGMVYAWYRCIYYTLKVQIKWMTNKVDVLQMGTILGGGVPKKKITFKGNSFKNAEQIKVTF